MAIHKSAPARAGWHRHISSLLSRWMGKGCHDDARQRMQSALHWCKANGRNPQAAVATLEPFEKLLADRVGGSDGPRMFLAMAESRGLDVAAALEDAMEWEDLDRTKVEEALRLGGCYSRAGLNGARGL